MDTVAQGAVWSDLTAPFKDADGAPITAGEADITVTLFDSADVNQSSGITVAHVDAGRYRVSKTISGVAATGAWGGTVVYDDGAGLVRTQVINFTVITPLEANPADPDAVADAVVSALSTAGVTSVTIITPVGEDNDLTIQINASYLNADGDAIAMTNAGWTTYDLTSATSVWFAALDSGGLALSKTVTVVDDEHIRFDLTSANTYAMRSASSYKVWAKLPSQTDPVLLVSGALSMQG